MSDSCFSKFKIISVEFSEGYCFLKNGNGICHRVQSVRRQNSRAISGFQCALTSRSGEEDSEPPICWSTSGFRPDFCPFINEASQADGEGTEFTSGTVQNSAFCYRLHAIVFW